MIDHILAQRLVDNISAQFGYRINVMNKKGVIIASTDASRIGDFHQGAYDLIQNKRRIYIARDSSDEFNGIKRGVNTLLYLNDEVIGAFGISGDPDDILPVLHLVKFSFEMILEYELFKINKNLDNNIIESFVWALFFEYPFSFRKVNKYAKLEGFTETIHRAPILVKFEILKDTDIIVKELKNRLSHNNQDFILKTSNDNFILFKSIPKSNISSYRIYIQKYVEEIKEVLHDLFLHEDAQEFSFFIGVPVLSFKDYAKTLSHVEWLSCFIKKHKKDFFYFTDYFLEFLMTKVPPDDLIPISLFYEDLISQNMDIKAFCQLIDEFFSHNMDINTCSSELFLHKNTLLQRLKKVKSAMEMENFKDVKNDILLSVLSYIFKGNIDKYN